MINFTKHHAISTQRHKGQNVLAIKLPKANEVTGLQGEPGQTAVLVSKATRLAPQRKNLRATTGVKPKWEPVLGLPLFGFVYQKT